MAQGLPGRATRLSEPTGEITPEDWTILLVDDNLNNVFYLESILRSHGYRTCKALGGAEALNTLKTRQNEIDLLLLDLMMPVIGGLDVLREVKANPRTKSVPVILLTANTQDDAAFNLDQGADDYLTKPVRPAELMARIRSALRMKKLRDELALLNGGLEQLVEQRSIELLLTRNAAIMGLAKLAECRDGATGGHLERTSRYTKALAQELVRRRTFGDTINREFISTIYESSPLHDIGKVGVPDSVLLKPGHLTPEEFAVIKTHTTIGGDALASSQWLMGEDGFLAMGRDIAYCHHERWDGGGYPKGLAEEAIPLAARIVAIADVYDALVSNRTYKKPVQHEEAVTIILSEAGKSFDPALTVAFRAIEQEFAEIRGRFALDQ